MCSSHVSIWAHYSNKLLISINKHNSCGNKYILFLAITWNITKLNSTYSQLWLLQTSESVLQERPENRLHIHKITIRHSFTSQSQNNHHTYWQTHDLKQSQIWWRTAASKTKSFSNFNWALTPRDWWASAGGALVTSCSLQPSSGHRQGALWSLAAHCSPLAVISRGRSGRRLLTAAL